MPTKAQLEIQLREARAQLLTQQGAGQGSGGGELEVGSVEDIEKEGHADDLERFFDEIGGEQGDLVVDGYRYRTEPDGTAGAYHYVQRWPMASFSLPRVQKEEGGGRWSFRVRTRAGKYLGSKGVSIEGPPKDKAARAGATDERSFHETVADTQSLMVETLKELRRGPPPELAAANPIDTAMSIVAAFQTVMAPYQEALLKQKSGGGPGFDFDKLVGIFESGVKLGEMAAPAAESPILGVLQSYLPGVLDAIGSQKAAPAHPLQALKNPPEAETMTAQPELPARPPWDMLIAPFLPMLYKWAGENKDPALRAAFVADELTPDAEAMILAQLSRGPDFLDEFLTLHPEAGPWKAWLGEFWFAVANQYQWGEDGLGPHPFHGAQRDIEGEVAEKERNGNKGVEVGIE